jgi:hypothetical protein
MRMTGHADKIGVMTGNLFSRFSVVWRRNTEEVIMRLNPCRSTLLGFGAVTVLSLLNAGCGSGGSSGTGTSNATPTTPVSPPTTLRSLASGLNYTYGYRGEVQTINGKVPFSGTAITEIANGTFNGQTQVDGFPLLLITNSYAVRVQGQQSTSSNVGYYYQNSNRDLYAVGESGDDGNFAYSPHILIRPGQHDALTSLSQEVQRSDDTTFQYSLTTRSAERVSVAAGTFDCWRVATRETDAEGTTTATSWYSPQVGTYVRREVVTTNGRNQIILQGTLALDSTNAL